MQREREKETFRRQRHHQSDRSWAVCVHACPTTKCTHTAQLRSDWWWRWRRNVSFSLSASLSLFSALTLFFSRSPLVFKTLFENACELQWVVLYLKQLKNKFQRFEFCFWPNWKSRTFSNWVFVRLFNCWFILYLFLGWRSERAS